MAWTYTGNIRGPTGASGATGPKGVNWLGAWDAGTTYEPGDAVTDAGSAYIALVESTGQTPYATDVVFWSLLAAKGDKGFNYIGPWYVLSHYVIGDVVTRNGSSYIAIAPGTGFDPEGPDRFDYWGGLAGAGVVGLTWRGAWTSGPDYLAHDAVSYQGSSYICIAETNAQLPTNTAFWAPLAIKGTSGTSGTNGTNGADGAAGNTVLSGSGAPSSGVGATGNFYIDSTAWKVYGPKAAGVWPAGVSIIGPTGAAGNAVLSGSGVPSSGLGVNGNFYIDSTAWNIYGPKAAGAWPAGVSIVGPTGATPSLSNATPLANGTAAQGTGTNASRDDHVHPGPTQLVQAGSFNCAMVAGSAAGSVVFPVAFKAGTVPFVVLSVQAVTNNTTAWVNIKTGITATGFDWICKMASTPSNFTVSGSFVAVGVAA